MEESPETARDALRLLLGEAKLRVMPSDIGKGVTVVGKLFPMGIFVAANKKTARTKGQRRSKFKPGTNPVSEFRPKVVAGAGFEPTTFGL